MAAAPARGEVLLAGKINVSETEVCRRYKWIPFLRSPSGADMHLFLKRQGDWHDSLQPCLKDAPTCCRGIAAVREDCGIQDRGLEAAWVDACPGSCCFDHLHSAGAHI